MERQARTGAGPEPRTVRLRASMVRTHPFAKTGARPKPHVSEGRTQATGTVMPGCGRDRRWPKRFSPPEHAVASLHNLSGSMPHRLDAGRTVARGALRWDCSVPWASRSIDTSRGHRGPHRLLRRGCRREERQGHRNLPRAVGMSLGLSGAASSGTGSSGQALSTGGQDMIAARR